MRTKTARHLAVFTMLLAVACRSDDEAATLPPFPEPGSLAPALALPVFLAPDGDHTVGDTVDLSDQRGHIVVLSFWATWCAPCLEKHPALDTFAIRYASKGVRVYGVLTGDSPRRAIEWLAAHGGATFPMLADSRERSGRRYLVRGIPHMVLIGPDGRTLAYCLGCRGFEHDFGTKIDSLFGDPPPTAPRPARHRATRNAA